jgi:hypothetical protein
MKELGRRSGAADNLTSHDDAGEMASIKKMKGRQNKVRICEQTKGRTCRSRGRQKVNIDSIDFLICACVSSMFMPLFHANARGPLRERTESGRRFGEDGVDFEKV